MDARILQIFSTCPSIQLSAHAHMVVRMVVPFMHTCTVSKNTKCIIGSKKAKFALVIYVPYDGNKSRIIFRITFVNQSHL
jgi:hypothetical protein